MRQVIDRMWGWSVILGGLLSLVLAGCGGDQATKTPTDGEERERAEAIVQEFESDLRRHLSREVVRRLVGASIVDLLPGEADHESSLPPHYRPPGEDGLVRQNIVRSVYQRSEHRPRWLFRGGEPLELQRELLALFERAVRNHGLWPDALHVHELRKTLRRTSTAFASGPRLRDRLEKIPETLSAGERHALIRAVARRLSDDAAGTGAGQRPSLSMSEVAELATMHGESAPTPRLADWLERNVEQPPAAIADVADQLARKDLRLTDATVHYAGVMRWDYKAWYRKDAWHQAWRRGETGPLRTGWPMNFEPGESPPDQIQGALSAARHRAALEGWVESRLSVTRRGDATMVDKLRDLQPDYEGYWRLTHAFPAYRGIVQRGGWPEIPQSARGLGPGDYAPGVTDVKRRLAIEGYFPDEESPTRRYTDALADAIRTYQSTHQLRRTGQVDAPTWRSLNVSARTRFNQMRVTMQRWRESRATDDSHYIRVNIPGFHLNLWRDGERQIRFRTMVGQATRKENEKTGEVRWPHATPRFSDNLRYLVFNPFWNVPHSIRINEIEPKLEENPDYLEEERLEKVTDPNGYTYYRQKPGPENALGRVKFMFPNRHSIYLHDTPHDALFRRPFRALSHGCIRVESPMKLVDYLLDRDGRWTPKERLALFKDWFAKDSESWVRLREPIPIHLEYYVVRADRQNRVHFFSDLYEINERRLEATSERLDALPRGIDVPAPGDPAWLTAALRGEAPDMPAVPVQFNPATSPGPPPQLPKRDRNMPEFLVKQAKRLAKKRKKQEKKEEKKKDDKKKDTEKKTEESSTDGDPDSENDSATDTNDAPDTPMVRETDAPSGGGTVPTPAAGSSSTPSQVDTPSTGESGGQPHNVATPDDGSR